MPAADLSGFSAQNTGEFPNVDRNNCGDTRHSGWDPLHTPGSPSTRDLNERKQRMGIAFFQLSDTAPKRINARKCQYSLPVPFADPDSLSHRCPKQRADIMASAMAFSAVKAAPTKVCIIQKDGLMYLHAVAPAHRQCWFMRSDVPDCSTAHSWSL
jgi:hypothetical protein